jgi:hypothetical protein
MRLISIGENIVEQHAMPVADSFRWQQAVIDQTHNRRATDTKEIGSFGRSASSSAELRSAFQSSFIHRV